MSDEPRRPGEEPEDGAKRAPGARYPLLVGLAFVALVIYATVHAVDNDEGALLGGKDDQRGLALAEFAVPDVRGDVEGDANLFQDDCETSDNPCPEEEQRVPACQIDPEGVLRVCDYFDLPLAISFWFTRGAECLPQQDVFDQVARRYRGRVNFLSINVRDDIGEVREIVEERDWSVPVGWDRDGGLSNVYRVGVCPTLALAYPGGILQDALIGSDPFMEPELTRSINLLLAESRERARQAN
jgi:hypothetical protein